MTKKGRTHRRRISKNGRNALFVFIIAFSAFLAFEPLFKHLGQHAGQEFAAAIFGTIFAAVITMVLLNKQTETEQEKDRNDKVFEQKLVIYNQVFDTLKSIFDKTIDGKQGVNRRDILDVEFLLTKMMMVGSDKTIHEFKRLYEVLTNNFSSKTKYTKLGAREREIILRFADLCREELGLSNTNMEREVVEDIVIHGEMVDGGVKRSKLGGDQGVELLKRVYGYLVFDLDVESSRIFFLPNGFGAYIAEEKKGRFMQCTIQESLFHIALNCDYNNVPFPVENHNNESTLVIDPNHILDSSSNYDALMKLIKGSLIETQSQLRRALP